MKTIIKSEVPPCLRQAQGKGWNWDEFRTNAYDDYLSVRSQALVDQKDECAYTGLWLGMGTTHTLHIDHFHKKAIFPEETLSWENLFAAAKNRNDGADYKDRQIHGTKSDAEKQYRAFWSPLEANLSQAFWYRQDGVVEPDEKLSDEEKEMAQHTIDMYNLNSPDLRNRRLGIIRLLNTLQDLCDDDIRQCTKTAGFSFLVDFELSQLSNRK